MLNLLSLPVLHLLPFDNLAKELGQSLGVGIENEIGLKLDLVQYYKCQSKINKENVSYVSFWRRRTYITILILLNIPILFLLHDASFFNLKFLLMHRKYHNIIIFLLCLSVIIISIILSGFILLVNDCNCIRNELFSIVFVMICSTRFICRLFLFYSNHSNVYCNIIWHSFLFLIIAYIKSKWVINKWYKLQINSSLINDINSHSINLYNN